VNGRDEYDRRKREWAELKAILDRPRDLVDDIARRLQPEGLILGSRSRLAHRVIPARITLDGSLPSCRPQAGPLWRATTPTAAPSAPTRETNIMTSTPTPKHAPTDDQLERQWGLEQARAALLTSKGAFIFGNNGESISGNLSDLIDLAEWTIGEKPEPEDDDDAVDIVHSRIHELTPEQAVEVAMHGFQHSGIPIVVAADLGNLADLPESDLNDLVNKAILGLNKLPTNVQEFIDRNKGVAGIDLEAADFVEQLIRRLSGTDTNVSVKDGSLVVDEASSADGGFDAWADKVEHQPASTPDPLPEQAEGGDTRTAETDAVVDEAQAAAEPTFDEVLRGDDEKKA
jgi:hypothetical protein